MFSYIERGSFFVIPFQMRGVILSSRSLKIFQMHNFQKFIFSKTSCSHPIYIHYPILCKLKWEGKPIQKCIQQRMYIFPVGSLTQCASQTIKRATIRENFTPQHHDSVAFPHDSTIILVKIHVHCKTVWTYVLEHRMFSHLIKSSALVNQSVVHRSSDLHLSALNRIPLCRETWASSTSQWKISQSWKLYSDLSSLNIIISSSSLWKYV